MDGITCQISKLKVFIYSFDLRMSDSNIGIDFTDETKSALYGAVLGKLREYNASSRLPSNMKWHKSYPTNWERLDNPKRQKVKQFWGSLPAELRSEILLSAQQEVAAANAALQHVMSTQQNTTKLDCCTYAQTVV